jgi:hypothetical protein
METTTSVYAQETSWQEHDKIHVCKQQISAKSFHSNHKDQMQEEQEDDCAKILCIGASLVFIPLGVQQIESKLKD